MASVYIVDSNDEIRSAAGDGLSSAIVCDNEIQALNEMEKGGSAIILLHYAVCHEGTAQYIELLKKANPTTEIVVLGDNQQDEDIIDCILAGANGYQNIETLATYAEKLIRVITAGEAWISRKMVARLIEHWRNLA